MWQKSLIGFHSIWEFHPFLTAFPPKYPCPHNWGWSSNFASHSKQSWSCSSPKWVLGGLGWFMKPAHGTGWWLQGKEEAFGPSGLAPGSEQGTDGSPKLICSMLIVVVWIIISSQTREGGVSFDGKHPLRGFWGKKKEDMVNKCSSLTQKWWSLSLERKGWKEGWKFTLKMCVQRRICTRENAQEFTFVWFH